MTKQVILLSMLFVLMATAAFAMQKQLLPEVFYSPGELSQEHTDAVKGCIDCHQPWEAVTGTNCTTSNCHSREQMAETLSPEMVLFHDKNQQKDCLACHSAHRGADGQKSTAFDHSKLEAGMSCTECHQLPKDELHKSTGNDCAACHTTETWQGAKIDHEKLAQGKACIDCHQVPADSLHKTAGNDCATCHTTESWQGAKFDHSQYYPLIKEHQVSCVKCHPGNDYSTYSCTSCHSEAKMLRKHRTSDYNKIADCMSCHRDDRSGSGHDGRERWEEGERSRYERDGERWSRSEYRRHEEDDE